MSAQFYAEYHSALTTTTGCVKSFVAGPSDDMQFVPQIERKCDLCDSNHQFYLKATHSVSSETQEDSLLEWAEKNSVEVIDTT